MLIKNSTLLTLSPPSISQQTDIRMENGVITERGKDLRPVNGEEVYNITGKYIMPGLSCAHTHIYSSLARGMPPPDTPPENFPEILKKIWWRLDRALDEESIYYSALIGAVEAVRWGTTLLIDHHASPSYIPNSLDVIKHAFEEVGIRGVLCYEVTDRGGMEKRDQGLEENERFIKANKENPLIRGMVGAHASFTLGDDSLNKCAALADTFNTGVHIHVAEDLCDVRDAKEKYNIDLISRLETHEILRNGSIFAHCIHLEQDDYSNIRNAGGWMVHNPRSNMNNNVGFAPVLLFGERAGLGTDGFPADMFEDAKIMFFKMRDAGVRPDPSTLESFITGGTRIASEIFGKKIGSLEKDAAADLIVLDYEPPTPLTEENLLFHYLFGMRSSMVESVMINGRWIVKDNEVQGIDENAVYKEASKAAAKLWEKMKSEK
jgi:putative selenium metabolism protein SsnA